MAEWLRRQTRNLVGIALVGSNPAVVELIFFCLEKMLCQAVPAHVQKLTSCRLRAPGDEDRSYYAGVSSDRTNLSPFTKDYRGLALPCDS